MPDPSKYVSVSFWVQIEPEFTGGDTPRVRTAKAERMTQKRPNGTQKQGTIMAPITMHIPRSAFLPLSPKIEVTIPEDMVTAEPIQIEVQPGE